MSVNENRIPSLASLRPGDTERTLGGDGCGWVCEVDGRIVAFAIADLSGANVYALFVEPGQRDSIRNVTRAVADTASLSAGPRKTFLCDLSGLCG
jgi:hypothetical protein